MPLDTTSRVHSIEKRDAEVRTYQTTFVYDGDEQAFNNSGASLVFDGTEHGTTIPTYMKV